MSVRKAEGAKIKYGNVEVSDEGLAPDAVRRRISIMIPEDVLAKLGDAAAAEGIGYQTLINRILRERVSASGGKSVPVELDERQLARVAERVANILRTTRPRSKRRA